MKLVDILVKLASEFEMMANDLDDAKDPTGAERFRRYYEKQKSDPNSPMAERERGKSEALREMRSSGSLDGLILILGTRIASYKKDLTRRLVRKGVNPETDPEMIRYSQDLIELYAVRDALRNFAKTLQFTETEQPLVADQKMLGDAVEMVQAALTKFANLYRPIGVALIAIKAKLSELTVR